MAAYGALLLLVLSWETGWAPATPLPRVFWIVVKTLPLIVPLPWLIRGSPYTHVLASLLLFVYFCEGVALGYDAIASSDTSALVYATGEIVFVLLFVVAASIYARISFRKKSARADEGKES